MVIKLATEKCYVCGQTTHAYIADEKGLKCVNCYLDERKQSEPKNFDK